MSSDEKRKGRAKRCCGRRRRGRCWANRRKKLSSLMLFSSLFAFGTGLLVSVQKENELFQTLCLANFVSSGCWHSNNLFMDGTPVGTAGKCCCWVDRVCVAVTVGFGVWLALAKDLQTSAACGALVPVLYSVKCFVPKSERYVRTIIHCVMHQVGVLGGLVSAVLALPPAEFEAEKQWWWDGVTTFLCVVCLIQPVAGWLAYQSTKSLSRRLDWIWV